MLLGAAAGYGYVRWRIDSIKTVAAPHLTRDPPAGKVADSAGGLAPENILLIGNETRAGLTNPTQIAQLGSPQVYSGSLSDVIMILHLDPAKDTASILSIPRDLFVPMPPGSPVGAYQKIDAALNDGASGPDNLIEAITDDLGIPINHFVELNFDGFESTVNALGGINVDFPERVFDAYSLLDITTPGCQHLDGAQALALVRARHLQYDPPGVPASDKAAWPYDPESDLSRIVRDHTFLRILASTAKSEGLTNPFKANAFIGAVINQITMDPGLKNQLVSLVLHYRHLNPGTFPETTLPVTQVGGSSGYYYDGVDMGDVDFPVQPEDNSVIAAWSRSALPAPRPPAGVQVLNLAGTYDLATRTASALASDGLRVVGVGDAQVPADTTETLVLYHPGDLAQALDVFGHLSGAVMLQQDAAVAPGVIQVQAGSLLSVTAPPGAQPPGAPSTAPASASTSTPAPGSGSVTGPTPGGQTASPAADVVQPWDPRPCPAAKG